MVTYRRDDSYLLKGFLFEISCFMAKFELKEYISFDICISNVDFSLIKNDIW